MGATAGTRLAALVAIACIAASCVTRATSVLVIVDTNAAPRVLSMHIALSAGSAVANGAQTHDWTSTELSFPASFGVVPSVGGTNVPVTLEVDLTLSPVSLGGPIQTLSRTARFHFTANVPSVIRLYLPSDCANFVAPPARCADGTTPCTLSHYCQTLSPPETCGDDAQCDSIDLTPVPLEPDGAVPGLDAITAPVDVAFVDHTSPSDHSTPADRAPPLDIAADRADTAADIADTLVDTPTAEAVCHPSCVGRSCGPDGCNGSCGTCPTNTICDTAGQCDPCTQSAPCSTGAECVLGTEDCSGSAPVCRTSGNAAAGTMCTGGVCNGQGTCVSCVQNQQCTVSNPCALGAIQCQSGQPVCATSGNAPAGTACPMGVCDGMGNCNQCMQMGNCSVGSGCGSGTFHCAGAMATCNVTTYVPAGTACPGGGGVCDGSGNCVPCTQGMSCTPSNPCATATIDCSTGAPVCTTNGNAPAGTMCSGGTCDGSGTCVPCMQGMSCTSTSDCVTTAQIDCSTGSPVCTPTGFVAAGTLCATGVYDGSECDGSGHCVCPPTGTGCRRCGYCYFSCTLNCP